MSGTDIPQIITLSQAVRFPIKAVGGKAWCLSRVMSLGLPVPDGFVVPPTANLEPWSPAADALAMLGAPGVAVRSSGVAEDGQKQSWAGQFESYLNVPLDAVPARIRDCRTSGNSRRAQHYDATGAGQAVAVIVQAMVEPECAGVMFTADPLSGSRDVVRVEAVAGLADALVGGEVTPQGYVLDKSGGQITQYVAADDPPFVTPALAQELAHVARRLEQAFGSPQDIEWAWRDSRLYILQARPITTL